METALSQNLRAANHAITRFVSELAVAKATPQTAFHPMHVDGLTAQLNQIEKSLGSLPPPGLRDEELAKELRIYVVNLGLLKKAIEDLGPVLEGKMRLVKAAIARLGAARSWSDSLNDLSK